MATQHPKIVNKQFNSPINLYSDANVREVLERETRMLTNGVVGINFHNPALSKPGNLQNSAVLRMLEEEEQRQRAGQPPSDESNFRPLREQIKWPPPEFDDKKSRSFKDVVTPGLKRVAWPPEEYFESQAPVHEQGGSPAFQNNYAASPQQQPPINPNYQRGPQSPANYQSPASYKPVSPGGHSSPGYQAGPLSPLSLNQTPPGYSSPTASKGWAPVHSPVHTTNQPKFGPATTNQYQPPQQQYQAPQQQYQAPQAQYQSPQNQYQPPQQYQNVQQQFQPPQQQYQPPQQQYQPPQQPAPVSYPSSQQSAPQVGQQQNQYQPQQTQAFRAPSHVEPPPSTITLRPKAPVTQAPPPVFNSQPATATLKGGKHLRGDLKWPPENVRQRMADEERHLVELSKGPACRPHKVEKDYSPFFAKHALANTYPGYKIPPGTQFYIPDV